MGGGKLLACDLVKLFNSLFELAIVYSPKNKDEYGLVVGVRKLKKSKIFMNNKRPK